MFEEIWRYKKDIFIIFFGSLLSFYFSAFGGVRVFDFLSLFILIYSVLIHEKKILINKKIVLYFIFFSFFILASVIVSLINDVVNIHVPRLLGTIVTIFYSLIFCAYYFNRIDSLIVGIKYTIYFHTFFFYIQFVLFNVFKIYIDFIEPITGNSSRNIGGKFNLESSIRASGLYSEPASYSLFVLTLMSVYIYYKKSISFIDLLVLVSVLFSMSASGLVYLGVFILVFFFYYSNKSIFFKLKIFITTLFLISFVYKAEFIDFEYVVDKVVNYEDSGSYQYRVGNTDDILNELNDFQVLFGIGYANMDVRENKGSTYSALFIEQGYFLGFLFLVSIFGLLRLYKMDLIIIGFVFVLFFGTHAFAQIQFWLWILSLLIVSKHFYYERKNISVVA